jgi:hypothetical protein
MATAIETADLEIQREPFVRPFAFKGSAFHEKWNTIVRLMDGDGTEAFGLGGLAVLWSDPELFASHTEVGGNALMVAVLEFALQQSRELSWSTPPELMANLLPEVYQYACAVTGKPDLKFTFVTNALVALDNAAWVLYARSGGLTSFDAMLPPAANRALTSRQERVLLVPAIGYNLPDQELQGLLQAGAAMLKIKLGRPGSEAEMLAADQRALTRVHAIVGTRDTPLTESGRVLYYLDANGRYGSLDSVVALLEHADAIGMLERVALLEEPFADGANMEVGDLPVRVAADESVHAVEDVTTRVQQGYGAVAIKAAGKTLSLALEMVVAALESGLTCFAADNACVPVLLEWNKSVAARLPAFPGVRGGILESNGPENYGRWGQMIREEHPLAGARWLEAVEGAYRLDGDYYRASGGILRDPTPYSNLFGHRS